MKSYLIFLLLLISLSFVYSQTNIESIDPGKVYGDKLYGVEMIVERIQLFFAGRGVTKANLHIYFADERLSEASYLADNERFADAEQTLIRYEQHIQLANNEIEKANSLGLDTSQAIATSENTLNKHVVVLESILDKLPESSHNNIAFVIDRAKERVKQQQIRKELKEKGIDFPEITGQVTAENVEELQKALEALRLKQEELEKKEQELKEKEEQDKEGLSTITGLSIIERQQLFLERASIILLISIAFFFSYFHYLYNKRIN